MTSVREEKKERSRAAILKAAGRLFTKRGFSRTSMADVARNARVAVGTVYNYFPSKAEVVLALLERDVSESLAAGEAVIKAPPADPVVAVGKLLCLEVTPFLENDREVWRELLGAAMRDPEVGSSFFASDVRLVGQLNRLLLELRDRGDLRDGIDTGRAAVALYGVFFTWLMAALTNVALPAEALREEIRTGVALVMNGLLEQTPEGMAR
jgi:AcrR family transcriptional regulator